MIILCLLLSFISGILVFRHPLFLLIFMGLIIIKRRDKRLFLFFSSAFIAGFLFIFCKDLISRLPFNEGYGIITNSGKHYYILLTFKGKYYVSAPDHNLVIGDIIYGTGKNYNYIFKTVEGEFDYAKYLMNKGIKSGLHINNLIIKIPSIFRLLKLDILKIITYPPHLEPLRTLLLKKTIDYDNPLIKMMLNYNMLFIISLTGAHLSLLRRTSKAFFSIFLKDDNALFWSYIVLLPLFLLQITKFAFYRIFITGFISYLNKKKWQNYFTYLEQNVLVAFIFLIIDPYFLFSEGFYLAYLLIFTFILFKPRSGLKGYPKRLFLLYIILVPYQILSRGAINVSTLFLPLLLTPLITLWYALYFITLPFFFLHNMPVTILNLIYYIITFFNQGVLILYIGSFADYTRVFIVYLLIVFLYSYDLKVLPIKRFSSLLLIYVLMLKISPIKNSLTLGVSFINVGQGDSILFNVYGQSLLVDTGGLYYKDVAQDVLIPYFKKHQIYSLNYLVITHDDFDHSGGKESLITNFKVHHVLDSRTEFPLTMKGVTFINLNDEEHRDKNDNSLILYVKLRNLHILLMGDASIKNEKALIAKYPALTVDILKVGHHGSNTSTSEAFIAHYLPRYAVISVGHQNKYGHPHQKVLDILNKYNVTIKRTDIDGTISFNSCII